MELPPARAPSKGRRDENGGGGTAKDRKQQRDTKDKQLETEKGGSSLVFSLHSSALMSEVF